MAVKKSHSPIKKASLLKRFLLSVLMIAFFGWLMLIGWASSLWLATDFQNAMKAIENLSNRQAFVVQEFGDSALLRMLNERLIPEIKEISRPAFYEAGRLDSELTQYIKNRWSEGDGASNLALKGELVDWWQDVKVFLGKGGLLLKTTGHVLLIKLDILIAAIPLFVVAMAAGFVDGLNQRAIRTASLGRESTYVFHKSIPLARKTMVLVLGLWLALPWVFSPSLVFVSLAVLLSLVVSMTASRFKKYL